VSPSSLAPVATKYQQKLPQGPDRGQ
jgi:hypothetical protein